MKTNLPEIKRWIAVTSALLAGAAFAFAGPPEGAPKPTVTPPSAPPTPPAPPSQVKIRREVEPPLPQPPQAVPHPAERPLSPTGRVNPPVAAGLETAKFAPSIRSASIATRDDVIGEVESRLSSSEKALDSIERSSGEMSADGRRQFKAASEDVKEKARALRKSVQAARKASGSEWDSARTQLARDYEAYGTALSRIETLSSTMPR